MDKLEILDRIKAEVKELEYSVETSNPNVKWIISDIQVLLDELVMKSEER